ncbi:hypothetical protein D3C80_1340390 [compost metagenome]
MPALLQGMTHQLMPPFPGGHVQQPVIPLILHRDALQAVLHHQTGEVIAEQDIAPTAQHQARQGRQFGVGQQLPEIIQLGHFGQPEAMRLEAQGIEGHQGGVGGEFHLRVPTRARGAVYPRSPGTKNPGTSRTHFAGVE